MAKIKYYYDTETCKYEKANIRKSDVVLNGLGFIVFTILLAFGLAVIYNTYYISPEELKLKNENAELKKHYKILTSKVGEVEQIVNSLQHRDDDIYRKIYEVEPLSPTIRQAGIGGNQRHAELLKTGFEDPQLVDNLFGQINKIKARVLVQNQSYKTLVQEAKNNVKFNIPGIQPVENKDLDKIASGFGIRIHPIHKGRYKHRGIDFAAPRGTPVYATADGTVKMTKKSDEVTGYGNQIELDHNNEYSTKYAHLESIMVKKGESIKRGQVISTVGNSGGSVAPHLHYEVIRNGEKINPVYYMLLGLDEHQYHQLLKLSSRENQSFD
jgi:murein DD-endopeptidase MepM/ murein hydrolase activator NlpD